MKSIETRFAEAMDALKKAGRTKKYEEAAKTCTTIETKLHAAEAVLKDAGVVREARPIKKNNGAVDTYVEGNPLGLTAEEFRESASNFSPGYIKEKSDPCAEGDKVMFDCMLKAGKITEAEHRKMTGQKPEGYAKLNEAQKKDFDFARLCGFSEADAFTMTNMTGNTFKEVSRR